MRDIMFKGISKETGEEVKGGLLVVNEETVFIIFPEINKKDNSLNIQMTIIEPESLCEYTGVPDDNGVDVYENDEVIVTEDALHDYKPGDSGYIGVGKVNLVDGKWHVDGTVDKYLYDLMKTKHVVIQN